MASLARILNRTRLELKPHQAHVANRPRIVTGFDHTRISRPGLGLRAIFVSDAQMPFVNNTHVSRLAALGSRNGLHALRRTPPRPEGEARRGRSGQPDDLDARLLRSARLVGRIEIARSNAGRFSVPFRGGSPVGGVPMATAANFPDF